MSGAAVLEVSGLTVRFGGLTAVDDVGFAVGPGEFVGVIGPNGAGKTTFIDAVSGLVRSTGEIVAGGRRLTGRPPHERVAAGVGRTFQSLELFEDLTVAENVLCAAERPRWWSVLRDTVRRRPSASAAATAAEVLDELGLADVADAVPADLSLGRRKLVTIARALACRPRVLLLDEPAAGLDSDESLALGTELRALVDRGMSIVMVEHDMGLVLGVCDELKVLEFGRLIAEGSPDRIRSDERVARAYLGTPDGLETSGGIG